MNLPAGTRLGPYEISGFIGAGAMGVVYKARDTRLGRDIAIKVLPPVFARDPDRLARFEREARAVAAINHPNIVSVHDIGGAEIPGEHHDLVRVVYLVTELLDGETLRGQLLQGPLGARRSLDVAIQVARGLAAAHDHGIVHRDIKPENLVLLRGGHVKILDFGLAKQPDSPAATTEQATMVATDAGTVLGTVGYMAPEQVRAEPADPRSDLFALGAVLYELVTGTRAFERATAAETMTAILREDPADSDAMPPGLASVIRHALEKDARDRFQSARDFAFALQALSMQAGSGASPAAAGLDRPRIRGRELAAWGLAAALTLALVSAPLWMRGPAARSSGAGSPIVFAPSFPLRDPPLSSPAVSPDDTRIAFIARGRAGDSIVVRRLDGLDAQPLKGTTGARSGGLFWSPDGQSLGFFAAGKLKVIDVATEKVDEIADAPSAYGGTWGSDGTILFSPDERTPIYRVAARGGAATPLTTFDASRGDQAHRWPQFLPDGRHFVFMPWKLGSSTRSIQLGSLDGGATRTLFDAASAAIVGGTYLLFAREQPSQWLAQAFNPRTLALEGRPAPVVADENVDYWWGSGEPWASASARTLVYTTGKMRISQLTWFNRTGRTLGTVGEPEVYYDPTVSPDGSTLAVEKRDRERGTTDLWTVDLARGVFSRLTDTPGFEDVATWTPDGRRIAFASDQATTPGIWVKNANGTGAEERLVEGRAFPLHWSRDGRQLLFMTDRGATRSDILLYDVERRSSTPILASTSNEQGASFSPDGKWIAYTSDEARDKQVYVRSYPEGATKIQISTGGGTQPQWRGDGRELFYLAPDSTLMGVEVHPAGAGLSVGVALPLFLTNIAAEQYLRNGYVASADGQRFLVVSPQVNPNSSPLVGVLNWQGAITSRK